MKTHEPIKTTRATQAMRVPVLVRFWSEDGVWNASAMDLPLAVFGHTFEEARANLNDALASHFAVLCELNRIDATVKHLSDSAKGHGYLERIPAGQTFEKMLIDPREPCLAHA